MCSKVVYIDQGTQLLKECRLCMSCIGSLLEHLASLLAAPQVFGAMYISLLAGNLSLHSDCVPLERSLVPHIHCKSCMQVLHHAQYQRGSLFVTDTAHWVTLIGCRLTSFVMFITVSDPLQDPG